MSVGLGSFNHCNLRLRSAAGSLWGLHPPALLPLAGFCLQLGQWCLQERGWGLWAQLPLSTSTSFTLSCYMGTLSLLLSHQQAARVPPESSPSLTQSRPASLASPASSPPCLSSPGANLLGVYPFHHSSPSPAQMCPTSPPATVPLSSPPIPSVPGPQFICSSLVWTYHPPVRLTAICFLLGVPNPLVPGQG